MLALDTGVLRRPGARPLRKRRAKLVHRVPECPRELGQASRADDDQHGGAHEQKMDRVDESHVSLRAEG